MSTLEIDTIKKQKNKIKRKSKIKLKEKTPSKELVQLIDSYFAKAKSFKKLLDELRTDREKIFEKGRSEGLSDIETGNLIRKKLKPLYSDRQIQRFLPDSAKHTEKITKIKEQKQGQQQQPTNQICRQMSAKSESNPTLMATNATTAETETKPETKPEKFDASKYPNIKREKPKIDYLPQDCLICRNGRAHREDEIRNNDPRYLYVSYIHYDDEPVGLEYDEKTGEPIAFKYRTCGPKKTFIDLKESTEAATAMKTDNNNNNNNNNNNKAKAELIQKAVATLPTTTTTTTRTTTYQEVANQQPFEKFIKLPIETIEKDLKHMDKSSIERLLLEAVNQALANNKNLSVLMEANKELKDRVKRLESRKTFYHFYGLSEKDKGKDIGGWYDQLQKVERENQKLKKRIAQLEAAQK